MKKSIMLLVALFVCTLTMQAQSQYSGDFFSVTIGDEWDGEGLQIEDGDGVSLFDVSGETINRAVVITAVASLVDLEGYIDLQKNADNPVFEGANFEGLSEANFAGYYAIGEDFTCTFNDDDTWGSIIAFNTEACTYFILMYGTDPNADFDTILSSLAIHQ